MKIYLIKHSDSATLPYNLVAHVDVELLTNGFYTKSVQAFLKRKEAIAYIKSLDKTIQKYREIVTFTNN